MTLTQKIFYYPLLAVLLALLPVALLGGKTPAALLALLALVALPNFIARPRWPTCTGLVVAVLALLGWGALSSFWALPPAQSLTTALQSIGLLLAAWLIITAWLSLPLTAQQAAHYWARAGFWLALALGIAEAALGSPLNNGLRLLTGQSFDPVLINRPALLLVLAAGVMLAQGLSPWLIFAGLLLFFIGWSSAAAAIMGALVLALVWLGARWRYRMMAGAVALAMGLTLVAAPLLPRLINPVTVIENNIVLPHSAYHRLYLWRFAAERIAEKPLAGWGFNGARALPGANTDLATLLPPPVANPAIEARLSMMRHGGFEVLGLHTHNMVLQVWVELGAVGVVLLALVLVTLWRAWELSLAAGGVSQKTQTTTAPATTAATTQAARLATLAALFTMAQFSYGAWQPWLWSGVVITLLPLIATPMANQPRASDLTK